MSKAQGGGPGHHRVPRSLTLHPREQHSDMTEHNIGQERQIRESKGLRLQKSLQSTMGISDIKRRTELRRKMVLARLEIAAMKLKDERRTLLQREQELKAHEPKTQHRFWGKCWNKNGDRDYIKAGQAILDSNTLGQIRVDVRRMCRKVSVQTLETVKLLEGDEDPYATFHAPWADVSFLFDLREAGQSPKMKEKKSKDPVVRLPVPRNCTCSAPTAASQEDVKPTVFNQSPSSGKRKLVKMNEIDEDAVLVSTDNPSDKKKRVRPGKENAKEASSLQSTTGPNDPRQTDEDLDEVLEIDKEEWEQSLMRRIRNLAAKYTHSVAHRPEGISNAELEAEIKAKEEKLESLKSRIS
ncbi:hypothetical protein JB92DRAFT_3128344 [Gautieria morchelliformis]|nr:hypothetical protein JB92DRAFT_3128344 [Gautieria morchelliformis]